MRIFIFSLFLIFNISFSYAQEKLIIGEVHQLESKILNEKRTINIYTPEGYSADSSKTYPVIYLLDGSANEDFIHVVGIVQFLTMIDAMPKTIIVGIANVDRKRYFTYQTSIKKDKENFPTAGSSAKFIDFLANELQPYITKKFKVNNTKTLIGQSLGGLLATEILLKHGKMFTNYIIVSPSLWWDDESLLKDVDMSISQQRLDNKVVFVAVGEEGNVMKNDAKHLAEELKKAKELKVNFEFFDKENHATILHNSIYQSLLKMNSVNK